MFFFFFFFLSFLFSHSFLGSEGVVELHGNLFEVVCLSCDFQVDRMTFQVILFS